jgi:hypothetical protein
MASGSHICGCHDAVAKVFDFLHEYSIEHLFFLDYELTETIERNVGFNASG